MRYLGIDYGAKRVGLAVTDAGGQIAFPRATIPNDAALFDTIARTIKDEQIQTIVVGDTRAFSGFENQVTKDTEIFVEKLKTTSQLPVIKAWEAGSSIEASRYSPEGTHSDSGAAAIILQRYVEMHPDTNSSSVQ